MDQPLAGVSQLWAENTTCSPILGFPRFREQCDMPPGHRIAPVLRGCPSTNPSRKIALRPTTRVVFVGSLLSEFIRPPVCPRSFQTRAV